MEILLPLRPGTDAVISALRDKLVRQFGGVTAHLRSPAEGVWKPDAGPAEKDQVVIVEVMVETLDRSWWERCRRELERDLKQDLVVIRAIPIELV